MSLQKLSNSVYARINTEKIPHSDSNKGYILCDEYVVVVDTTHFLKNVRSDIEELRKITDLKVGYVINTHYHSDHSYGNFLFDCPIVAHKECPRLMKKVRKLALAELLREETDLNVRKELRKLKLRYPNVLFEWSYKIDSSPGIQVIHLGGHTPDLSVVYIPEEGILFASDNLFGSPDPSTSSHPYMTPRSDLGQWMLALKEMLSLEAKVIVPGHFGLCNKQAASKLIEYLQLFIANVRKLKGEGYSKEEVKRRQELLNLPKLNVERWVENNIEAQYDRI